MGQTIQELVSVGSESRDAEITSVDCIVFTSSNIATGLYQGH